jgi:hypothetical protein
MASERQIAANRANAKRSTGPKTLVGKMKSRRNALRHGLSLPLPFDMEASARGEAIVRALTHDHASDEQLTAATELAQAQLELQRIRAVRAELVARVASGDLEEPQRLGRSTATRGSPPASVDGHRATSEPNRHNKHGPSEQSGFPRDHNWDTLRQSEREG